MDIRSINDETLYLIVQEYECYQGPHTIIEGLNVLAVGALHHTLTAAIIFVTDFFYVTSSPTLGRGRVINFCSPTCYISLPPQKIHNRPGILDEGQSVNTAKKPERSNPQTYPICFPLEIYRDSNRISSSLTVVIHM